jgi:hypothetical protein
MAEPDILREELVELSVMRAITAGLPDFGYTLSGSDQDVKVREAFPTATERGEELTMTTLAFGFNSDDGGEQAELGSNLTRQESTLVCWVFALEPAFGRRLGFSVKHIARRYGDSIPLYDFNETPDDPPKIDTLQVLRVQTRHEVNNSVRPWDRYVWTTAIVVRDIYYPT